MSAMKEIEAPLQLAGVHLQPYNEVVRPGQIWKVSKYFLRRWTPYMPASHLWLIIGARQESYFNGNRPWFTAYDQNLAAAAGLHVRSFRRTAKKEIVEGRGALACFISKQGDPAYVTGQPVPKLEETRYQVRLDDPLTPADAEALAFWLRRHAPRQITPENICDLLTAARQEPSRTFHADNASLNQIDDSLLTVVDVVRRVFPDVAQDDQWREAADRLHTHIVEPQLCHLETQYLRRKGLPELGPGPMLLFVYLRSLCYHNPQTGETRDQVQILSGDLEKLFQKSSVTVRAWFSQLDELLGAGHPHGPFIEALESSKRPDQKVATSYRLNLLTPLFPDDMDTYRGLLRDGLPQGAAGVTQELSATSTEGEQSFVSHAGGGDARNGSHVAEGQVKNVSHAQGGEQSFVRGWVKKWQPYKYYKALFDALGITESTQLEEITQQQQHAWKVENGEALKSFAAAAVGSLKGLLDHFGIYGKTRKKILEGPLCLEEVVAWYLYAEREPGLDYPERYMMKQAAAGNTPPEQFLQLAQLSWERWRVFASSCRIDNGAGERWGPSDDDAIAFELWCRTYEEVSLWSLPFAVGEGLEELCIGLDVSRSGCNIGGMESENQLVTGSNGIVEDQQLWEEVLKELSLQMTRATFERWLKDSRLLSREGDVWVVGVRSVAAQAWVDSKLRSVIERTATSILLGPVSIEVELL